MKKILFLLTCLSLVGCSESKPTYTYMESMKALYENVSKLQDKKECFYQDIYFITAEKDNILTIYRETKDEETKITKFTSIDFPLIEQRPEKYNCAASSTGNSIANFTATFTLNNDYKDSGKIEFDTYTGNETFKASNQQSQRVPISSLIVYFNDYVYIKLGIKLPSIDMFTNFANN